MVKMRKKKYSKKSNVNKNIEYKTKSQKQFLNNISSYDIIFDVLNEGNSITNAEKIEKELLEKVDNKQNTPTDFDEKLNQIKSTNATENDKKNKKICFKRETIIKLRRKNLLIKRLKNLQKKYCKKTNKYFKSKNKIKNEDDSISDITKETPSPIIKNVIKNEIKSNLEDKKIDEKKSMINKDKNCSNLNENKKGDKKYISKTEKVEDKKINFMNEENININNNNEDNMSLSLSENNNNNEQIQPQNGGININNNEDNMSISSSNSNPNVLIYENSENSGSQINNQNPTENNVVNLDNEDNLNDDLENNNINIDGMNEYVNYLDNLPNEENNNVEDNGDALQNPDFGNLNSNKQGIK